MQLTTLCYIKQDNRYLMMHRTKKEKDPNEGKWIGIGGKFEEGESPEECLLREVKEETNLILTSFHFHGVITFVAEGYEMEQMFLYTADDFEGELAKECREGELAWIDMEKVMDLNLWEGDRIFLKLLLEENSWFNLKLCYKGDELVKAVRDGKIDLLASKHQE